MTKKKTLPPELIQELFLFDDIDEEDFELPNKEHLQEFKEILKDIDRRLSKRYRIRIQEEAQKEGFESPSFWLYFKYKTGSKILELSELLNIRKGTVSAIIKNIISIDEDKLSIFASHDWRKKTQGKLCGKCGKNPRHGYYFCVNCLYKLRETSNLFDLDMLGDF